MQGRFLIAITGIWPLNRLPPLARFPTGEILPEEMGRGGGSGCGFKQLIQGRFLIAIARVWPLNRLPPLARFPIDEISLEKCMGGSGRGLTAVATSPKANVATKIISMPFENNRIFNNLSP
jgi:hypothetical protein